MSSDLKIHLKKGFDYLGTVNLSEKDFVKSKDILLLGNLVDFFGRASDEAGNINFSSASKSFSNSDYFMFDYYGMLKKAIIKGRNIKIITNAYGKEYFVNILENMKRYLPKKKQKLVNILLDKIIVVSSDTDYVTELIKLKMKFNYILINAPYNGSLHLEITEYVLSMLKDESSICVNLSPADKYQKSWLYDKSLPINTDIGIQSYLIEMMDAAKIFSANIRTDLAISVFSKSIKCRNLDSLLPNKEILIKIINGFNKISKTNGLLKDKFINNPNQTTLKFGYCSTIAGHGGFGKACYTIVSPFYDTATSTDATGHVRYVDFIDEITRKDAYRLYSLVLMRFAYKELGFGYQPYNIIPYISKKELKYGNNDFCKLLGITGFISDTEAEPGSEWETIINTMKPYLD